MAVRKQMEAPNFDASMELASSNASSVGPVMGSFNCQPNTTQSHLGRVYQGGALALSWEGNCLN